MNAHSLPHDLASRAPALVELFSDLISRRVAPPARAWLTEARAATQGQTRFSEAFTLAARKVGKAPLDPTGEEIGRLASAGLTWPLGVWGLDELGRVTLLLSAAGHVAPDELQGVVEDCYRAGDNRERQAVLRALVFLPSPERFLEIAVDACRTSVEPVFEAIACENPYPATYFPELNFNQMVLKAAFIGIALERILGLDARVTSELSRMARDYASERRAAGRPVPADLWRLTGEEKP